MAWDQLAPQTIGRLAQDLKITPQQAAGIVGQLGHESAGLQAINEASPVVPGSRGGFGWAQWTGPRRRQFEEFASGKGLDVTDPEANYGFLVHELTSTPEGRVLDNLRKAPDAMTAGRVFTDEFLRPGVPAYESRDSWTERAMNFLLPAAQAATVGDPGNWWEADEAVDAQQQSSVANWWDTDPVADSVASAGQTGPQAINSDNGGIGAAIVQGLRDPIDAGAQMLRRAVPDVVGRAVDQFGNYLSDIGLPVARSDGVEGIDSAINEREATYQAARQAVGRGDGMDWARMAGNIVGIAPAMMAMPAGGAGLFGRMGAGAAQGAVAGALQPVTGGRAQQDFGGEKLSQAGLGAAIGGIAPAVISGVSRVVSPRASLPSSPAQTLVREGVELTPGQALGGALMRMEDRAMSAPILGDAIRGARGRANESLNRAVYNRVLSPIGESTASTGRRAVEDAAKKVSQAYDDVLSQVRFTPDQQFSDVLRQINRVGRGLPLREARQLQNELRNEVVRPLTAGRYVDGRTFKVVEEQLGNRIQKYARATDVNQRNVADGLREALNGLRENLVRLNPQHARQLRAANAAYANLVRLESAAGRIGAHDGVFTPQQLAQAIRQSDRTVRRRAYSRGSALMQDLSDAAQDRMSARIPDSGTAERLMLNTGAIGAGLVNPAIPVALGAASVPYLPGLSRAATAAVMNRPASAQRLAEALRQLPTGYLGVLAGSSD